jgi:hypothetical protein
MPRGGRQRRPRRPLGLLGAPEAGVAAPTAPRPIELTGREGCMFCGEPLVHLTVAVPGRCHDCGRPLLTSAVRRRPLRVPRPSHRRRDGGDPGDLRRIVRARLGRADAPHPRAPGAQHPRPRALRASPCPGRHGRPQRRLVAGRAPPRHSQRRRAIVAGTPSEPRSHPPNCDVTFGLQLGVKPALARCTGRARPRSAAVPWRRSGPSGEATTDRMLPIRHLGPRPVSARKCIRLMRNAIHTTRPLARQLLPTRSAVRAGHPVG